MSTTLRSKQYPSGQRLELAEGDLTDEAMDAIVNPANGRLKHGGGLARAIRRAGGRVIQKESDAWVREHGAVSHAEPAYTSSGKLPCRYVIHAVGPVWGSGDEDTKLTAAISGSLKLADRLQLASLAVPAISTGIFGFPKDRAAVIIFRAIDQYFTKVPESGLNLVRVTLFDQPTQAAFVAAWDSADRGAEER